MLLCKHGDGFVQFILYMYLGNIWESLSQILLWEKGVIFCCHLLQGESRQICLVIGVSHP